MTNVLRFPVDQLEKKTRQMIDNIGEIIIFPGVRIERGEFCLSDRLASTDAEHTAGLRRVASSEEKTL